MTGYAGRPISAANRDLLEPIREMRAEGKTFAEIAKILGVTDDRVKNLAKRHLTPGGYHKPKPKPRPKGELDDLQPVRIEDYIHHPNRGCQFITKDDPPFTDQDKCGKPVLQVGGSFCLQHHKICYVRMRVVQRFAVVNKGQSF